MTEFAAVMVLGTLAEVAVAAGLVGLVNLMARAGVIR